MKYLVDTGKTFIFTEGEMTPYDKNCPMAQVQATNHRQLFITDTTDKFKQMAKENIDIQMDISMTSEYLEYHIDKTFLDSYRQINQQICKTRFYDHKDILVPLQQSGKFAKELGCDFYIPMHCRDSKNQGDPTLHEGHTNRRGIC